MLLISIQRIVCKNQKNQENRDESIKKKKMLPIHVGEIKDEEAYAVRSKAC